ncbi:MAG TPA: hypothetical protein VNZ48_17700 [Xanthobacteraceae bacterium]|jgi:hypothetical protein|nr:hypothetical protein [Xanthobacteraceae bacterium]
MMKFTLAWLKEHLDTDRTLGEIVESRALRTRSFLMPIDTVRVRVSIY